MCEYFSCIVTKGGKALWLKNSMSHEDIIHEYKLDDMRIDYVNLPFVRLEIVPIEKGKITRNKKDWILNVDQQPQPDWYILDPEKYNKYAWDAWRESIQINLALGEERRTVKDVYIKAYDNSTVIAHGKSLVFAYERSVIQIHDESHVTADDNSVIEAHDNSHVGAYDNTTVEAYDDSLVFLHDNSVARTYGSCEVYGYNNSTVYAYNNTNGHIKDNSTAETYDRSVIHAYDKSNIIAHNDSLIKLFNASTVKAFDNSMIYDHHNPHEKPVVKLESDTAILIRNNMIYVRDISKVKEVDDTIGKQALKDQKNNEKVLKFLKKLVKFGNTEEAVEAIDLLKELNEDE
ncbi:MAG: hypothetical protein ACTSPB_11975 [Candidatus Thorarchaeota archaeon]